MRYPLRLAAVAFVLVMRLCPPVYPLEYLGESAVDVERLLPAPPSTESEESKSELKIMLHIQKHRTAEQIDRCKAEAKLGMAAFQPVFGPWFTADNLPEMEKFFKRIHGDAKFFSDSAKRHFNRPRPHKIEARIQPVVEKDNVDKDNDDEPSYPSGHSTRGMIYALMLSEIAPEKKAALLERGRAIGWDRVIAGVHYPSDVAAGRTLGQAIEQALVADPGFRGDLKRVKAEFEEVQERQTNSQEPTASDTSQDGLPFVSSGGRRKN